MKGFDGELSRTVAVVMTVKNDADGCETTLTSLVQQTRPPDEVIVVDGGSTDGTQAVLERFAGMLPQLRTIEARGVNIAGGRNIGIKSTDCEIIVLTDAGCRAEPHWLASLVSPFFENRSIGFVAGVYRIEPHSLLESVVGLGTMRGQMEPFDPDCFNPSARSMAITKRLWQKTGGFPEWLRYSEDTLFDLKLRSMGAAPHFAAAAVVYWRPRATLRQIARQFYNYGTGRGHTQIGAVDFAYNIRNAALVIAAGTAACVSWLALPILAAATFYFYVWAFHRKAALVALETRRWAAYPLYLLVMWTVLLFNILGYIRGSLQRLWQPDQYVAPIRRYMAGWETERDDTSVGFPAWSTT